MVRRHAQEPDAASYPLDRRGFLADPSRWDPGFCELMAPALLPSSRMTLQHLKVVLFVRRWFVQRGEVARVYQTCRSCGLSLARMRQLFPCGYQRGVCRLAGIPYRVIDRDHPALTYETRARDGSAGRRREPRGGGAGGGATGS